MDNNEQDEPLLINEDPKGENNMSARALYMQRKLYDNVAYSNPVLTKTTPIDLRKKALYGKTYTDIVSFVLKDQRTLRQIPSETETVMVLDFVRDAYVELKERMDRLIAADVIDPESPYYNLSPKSGYQDINVLYQEHMSALYTKFINYVSSYKKINEIKDFKSFLDKFVKFVDEVTPLAPITRAKFIKSRDVPQTISGLVINLENDDASRDENKILKYINDSNLSVFKHACEVYSFKIDKHVPWRIVFDIRSPAADKYYSKYQVNKDTVLNTYYNPSYFTDLEILKSYIINFYNSFSFSNRENFYEKTKVVNNKICVGTESAIRQTTTLEQINNNHSPDIWINLYTFIRAREENINWSQEVYENHAKNAYLLYSNSGDSMKCFKYIHSKTNYKTNFGFKQRSFHFNLT